MYTGLTRTHTSHQPKMGDPVSEQRAMVLLTLPYPPLPVIASSIEADSSRVDGERVTTTHTLLSVCMNDKALRNDRIDNERRQIRQRQVFRSFLYGMASRGFDLEGEELYKFYCDFSKMHIDTYFAEGFGAPPIVPFSVPPIVFEPLHNIARGDTAHKKMCEYMAAQSLIFHEENKTREYYASFEFIDLLKQVRSRLGHVMTDDERKLADAKEKEFMETFKREEASTETVGS